MKRIKEDFLRNVQQHTYVVLALACSVLYADFSYGSLFFQIESRSYLYIFTLFYHKKS